MDEIKVFEKISNDFKMSNRQKEILQNYIKVFLVPHTSNKWTRTFAADDLRKTAVNLLGFEIGMRDFLDSMYCNKFSLRPAQNLAIIGYYKVKANYYDLAARLYKQLKENNLKIEIIKDDKYDFI
jgi:hypothetical protein